MKKLFFIALFAIGLTTTVKAQQCYDQNDIPGLTGSLNLNVSLAFGNDIETFYIDFDYVYNGISWLYKTNTVDFTGGVDPHVNTLSGWGVSTLNRQEYRGAIPSNDGHYYYFTIVILNGKIDTWEICRLF